MSVSPAEHNRIIWRDFINQLFRWPFFVNEHFMFPMASFYYFPGSGLCNLCFNFLGYYRWISGIPEFNIIGIERTEMNMSIIKTRNYEPSGGINNFCGSLFYHC